MEKIESIILDKLMNHSGRTGETVSASKKGTVEVPCEFDANTCFNDLHLNIAVMERTRNNLAHRHIFSHRKVVGKLIVFGKKVVRKCLKWYINPFAEQQLTFNNGARYAIGRLTQLVTELFSRSEKVKTFQETVEVEIDKINDQMVDFLNEIDRVAKQEEQYKCRQSKTEKQMEQLLAKSAEQEEQYKCRQSETEKQMEQLLAKSAEQEEQYKCGQSETEKQMEQLLAKLVEQEAEQKNARSEADLQMRFFAERLAGLEAQMAADKQDQQKGFLSFAEQMTNSQSGEDSIVAYIALVLGYQPQNVTYLDLGANHAKDMSNTYRFYQYGARGVLVEANPELIPELNKFRNGDVIINKCISATDGEMVDFFIMSGDGLSTKSEASADNAVEMNPTISIKEKVSVESVSVNTLLEKYFAESPVLLNVDLEGCEMEVLLSIDFEKYRPLIIIVETIPYSTSLVVGQKNTEVIDFLNQKGYIEYAFTGINSIFIDRTKLR